MNKDFEKKTLDAYATPLHDANRLNVARASKNRDRFESDKKTNVENFFEKPDAFLRVHIMLPHVSSTMATTLNDGRADVEGFLVKGNDAPMVKTLDDGKNVDAYCETHFTEPAYLDQNTIVWDLDTIVPSKSRSYQMVTIDHDRVDRRIGTDPKRDIHTVQTRDTTLTKVLYTKANDIKKEDPRRSLLHFVLAWMDANESSGRNNVLKFSKNKNDVSHVSVYPFSLSFDDDKKIRSTILKENVVKTIESLVKDNVRPVFDKADWMLDDFCAFGHAVVRDPTTNKETLQTEKMATIFSTSHVSDVFGTLTAFTDTVTNKRYVDVKYAHKTTKINNGSAFSDFEFSNERGDDAVRFLSHYESVVVSPITADYVVHKYSKRVYETVEKACIASCRFWFWEESDRTPWYVHDFEKAARNNNNDDRSVLKRFCEQLFKNDDVGYSLYRASQCSERLLQHRIFSKLTTSDAKNDSTIGDSTKRFFLAVVDCLFEDVDPFDKEAKKDATIPITFRYLMNTIFKKEEEEEETETFKNDLHRWFGKTNADWLMTCEIKEALFDKVGLHKKSNLHNNPILSNQVVSDDVVDLDKSNVYSVMMHAKRFKERLFAWLGDLEDRGNERLTTIYTLYHVLNAVVCTKVLPYAYSKNHPKSVYLRFKTWLLERFFEKDNIHYSIIADRFDILCSNIEESLAKVWTAYDPSDVSAMGDYAKYVRDFYKLTNDYYTEEVSKSLFYEFLNRLNAKGEYHSHFKTASKRRADASAIVAFCDKVERFTLKSSSVVGEAGKHWWYEKGNDYDSYWYAIDRRLRRGFPKEEVFLEKGKRVAYHRFAFCRLKNVLNRLDGLETISNARDVSYAYGRTHKWGSNGDTVVTMCKEKRWDKRNDVLNALSSDAEKYDARLCAKLDHFSYYGDGKRHHVAPKIKNVDVSWPDYVAITPNNANDEDRFAPAFEAPGHVERLNDNGWYYFSDANRIDMRYGAWSSNVKKNDRLIGFNAELYAVLTSCDADKMLLPVPCARFFTEGQCVAEVTKKCAMLKTFLKKYDRDAFVEAFEKNKTQKKIFLSDAVDPKHLFESLSKTKTCLKNVVHRFDLDVFYPPSSTRSTGFADGDDASRHVGDSLTRLNWSADNAPFSRSTFHDRLYRGAEEGGGSYALEWHFGKTYGGKTTFLCEHDYRLAHEDVLALIKEKRIQTEATKYAFYEDMNVETLELSLFVIKKYPKHNVAISPNETSRILFGLENMHLATKRVETAKVKADDFTKNDDSNVYDTIAYDYLTMRSTYHDNITRKKTKWLKDVDFSTMAPQLSPLDFIYSNYMTPFSSVSNPFDLVVDDDDDDDALSRFETAYEERRDCTQTKLGISLLSDVINVIHVCTHHIRACVQGVINDTVSIRDGKLSLSFDRSGNEALDASVLYRDVLGIVSDRFLFKDPESNAYWLNTKEGSKISLVNRRNDPSKPYFLWVDDGAYSRGNDPYATFFRKEVKKSVKKIRERNNFDARESLMSFKIDTLYRYFIRREDRHDAEFDVERFVEGVSGYGNNQKAVFTYERNDAYNDKHAFTKALSKRLGYIGKEGGNDTRYLEKDYEDAAFQRVVYEHMRILYLLSDEILMEILKNVQNVDRYIPSHLNYVSLKLNDSKAKVIDAFESFEPNAAWSRDALVKDDALFSMCCFKSHYDSGYDGGGGGTSSKKRYEKREKLSMGVSWYDVLSAAGDRRIEDLYYANLEMDYADDWSLGYFEKRNDTDRRDALKKSRMSFMDRKTSSFFKTARLFFPKKIKTTDLLTNKINDKMNFFKRFAFELSNPTVYYALTTVMIDVVSGLPVLPLNYGFDVKSYAFRTYRYKERSSPSFFNYFNDRGGEEEEEYVRVLKSRSMDNMRMMSFEKEALKAYYSGTTEEAFVARQTRQTRRVRESIDRHTTVFNNDVDDAISCFSEAIAESVFDALTSDDEGSSSSSSSSSLKSDVFYDILFSNASSQADRIVSRRGEKGRCFSNVSHAVYLDTLLKMNASYAESINADDEKKKTKKGVSVATKTISQCLTFLKSPNATNVPKSFAHSKNDSSSPMKTRDVVVKCLSFMYDFWVGVSKASQTIVLPGSNENVPKVWAKNRDDTTWYRSIFPENTLNRTGFSKRKDDFEVIRRSDIVKDVFSKLLHKLREFKKLISFVSSKYGERMVYHLVDSYVSFEKNLYAESVKTIFETMVSSDSMSAISDYNKLTVLIFDINENNGEWADYYGYKGTPTFQNPNGTTETPFASYSVRKEGETWTSVDRKDDFMRNILSGLSLKSFFKLFSDTVRRDKFKTESLNRLWRFYASDKNDVRCVAESEHETFLKKIASSLSSSSSSSSDGVGGFGNVWTARLKCFGYDRLKKWIPGWAAHVSTLTTVSESGREIFVDASLAYASHPKSRTHLFLSKAFVDCYYENATLTVSKSFKVTRSVQKDEIASKRREYESYAYALESVLKRDRTIDPSKSGHEAFFRCVSETLFLNDVDCKYLPKFSFLNANASDVFLACNDDDRKNALRRRYRTGLSTSNGAFGHGDLQKDLVKRWIERGEYTIHPTWMDALVFVPGDRKERGEITLDVDLFNNVLLVERYVYPLIKEMSTYHLVNPSDTNDYLKDYMNLLETVRKQIVYNTSLRNRF